jgi:hypothetical protein
MNVKRQDNQENKNKFQNNSTKLEFNMKFIPTKQNQINQSTSDLSKANDFNKIYFNQLNFTI